MLSWKLYNIGIGLKSIAINHLGNEMLQFLTHGDRTANALRVY
jgi:hypothetical protein